MTNKWTCSNCGQENYDESTCEFCGNAYNGIVGKVNIAPARKSTRTITYYPIQINAEEILVNIASALTIGGLVIAFILAIVGYLLISDRNEEIGYPMLIFIIPLLLFVIPIAAIMRVLANISNSLKNIDLSQRVEDDDLE